MIRIIYTALFALLISGQLLSQGTEVYCGSQYPKDVRSYLKPALGKNTENRGIHKVPLKYHIIKNDRPNWYDSLSQVNRDIRILNEYFAPADLEFYLCGEVDFIYDPVRAEGVDGAAIVSYYNDTHSDTNAINVYIPVSVSSPYVGYSFAGAYDSLSYFSQYPAIILLYGNDSLVLAHELGHYMGLYHPSGPYSFSEELVDGSNCSYTGDYCCDTPAEFVQMCCPLQDCSYFNFGGLTDANGDTLRPDPTNIMTTIQLASRCRNHFSPDQYARIRYYYEHYLSNLDCREISTGPDWSLDNKVVLSPNPNHGNFMIKLTDSPDQFFDLKVYAADGVLVVNKRMTGESTVEVQALPGGIYIARIEGRNGSRAIRKVVVQ